MNIDLNKKKEMNKAHILDMRLWKLFQKLKKPLKTLNKFFQNVQIRKKRDFID